MIATIELHGKTFNIEKRNKEWQTNYRNAKATFGRNKANVIRELKAIGKDKLVAACNSQDKIVERDIYFKAHTEVFTTIFGFTPPRDFVLYALGYGLSLDVIVLDKKLRTPNGISTKNHILKVYGEVALNIVDNML